MAMNSPTEITGLILWLDGNDVYGTNNNPNDGDAVGTWVDKSEQNNNVVGGDSADGGRFLANAQNGLGLVHFERTSSHGYKRDSLTGGNLSQPYTFFIVFRYEYYGSSPDFYSVFTDFGGDISIGRNFSQSDYTPNTGDHGLKWSLGSHTKNTKNHISPGTFYYISTVFDGVSSKFEVNGDLIFSSLGADSSSITKFRIGLQGVNNNFMQGEVAEVLLYNSVLSTPNREEVNDYLDTKWALTPPDIDQDGILNIYEHTYAVNNGFILAPSGNISVSQSIQVASTQDLKFEIRSVSDYDSINYSTYSLDVTGSITVTLNGYMPVSGDVFEVATGNSIIQGTFNAFNMPLLDVKIEWSTANIYSEGTLLVKRILPTIDPVFSRTIRSYSHNSVPIVVGGYPGAVLNVSCQSANSNIIRVSGVSGSGPNRTIAIKAVQFHGNTDLSVSNNDGFVTTVSTFNVRIKPFTPVINFGDD